MRLRNAVKTMFGVALVAMLASAALIWAAPGPEGGRLAREGVAGALIGLLLPGA